MLRMRESGLVGVRHRFVRKQGLSDPSVMQQWLASSTNSTSSLSSRGSSSSLSDDGSGDSEVAVTVCIQPLGQAGARKAVCMTAQ